MNVLHNIYQKTLAENDKNTKFWEDYLKNLYSLDFNIYSEKLTVPILVPIGNRILFRGNLKHTNEVTVALGADYFAKCSTIQADILRQHRIKDAKSKLDVYYKEREYLKSQLSFNKNIEDVGQNIIEHCTVEEDREWRKAHKERVRKYHQSKSKKESNEQSEVADDELFRRLEELELQEELEDELSKIEATGTDSTEEKYESYIINEERDEGHRKDVAQIPQSISHETSKLDLLQQVIDRQKAIETKLTELKNRDRIVPSTENDLLSRLDEIEQLEELEDEMERLDDILDDDNSSEDSKEDSVEDNTTTIKQSVSFHDDDSETLELTFRHSDVEPKNEPYDDNKGITKPSDIYSAFSNLFVNKTKSILKKSKYESAEPIKDIKKNVQILNELIKEEEITNRTIEIKDVSEKVKCEVKSTSSGERPMSIFKKRRQQKM